MKFVKRWIFEKIITKKRAINSRSNNTITIFSRKITLFCWSRLKIAFSTQMMKKATMKTTWLIFSKRTNDDSRHISNHLRLSMKLILFDAFEKLKCMTKWWSIIIITISICSRSSRSLIERATRLMNIYNRCVILISITSKIDIWWWISCQTFTTILITNAICVINFEYWSWTLKTFRRFILFFFVSIIQLIIAKSSRSRNWWKRYSEIWKRLWVYILVSLSFLTTFESSCKNIQSTNESQKRENRNTSTTLEIISIQIHFRDFDFDIVHKVCYVDVLREVCNSLSLWCRYKVSWFDDR